MTAEAVPLDEAEPGRRRLGGLLLLEGWHLSSRDVRLGGISAMHVEGGQVLALSDGGSLIRFPLPRRPGPLPLNIVRVPHGPGTGRRKGDRDGESMAVSGAAADGDIWVAWEGRNAIWRYRRSDWSVAAATAPRAMRRWQTQRGPEAMVRLPNGRFLVFAEGPRAQDGTTAVLLFLGDPAAAATRTLALRYRPPAGYRATDAAMLPDGRLLILNRRFRALSGFSVILRVADLRRLRGNVIEGEELAAFTGSATRDNYEALSVTREGARTIVWIASDDNYTPLLQRTLLMKFALAE